MNTNTKPQHIAQLFELSSDLLCVVGFDGYFKHLNPAWEKALGYPLNRLLSQPIMEYIHPDDRSAFKEINAKLSSGTQTLIFENRYLCQNGTYKWLMWNITTSHPEQVYYGIAKDITLQRQALSHLNRFFTSSLDMLCLAGFDGYFKMLNPVWSQTLGLTMNELMTKPFIEFVHPDDRKATLTEMTKLTTGLATVTFENRCICKDGSYKWLLWNCSRSTEDQLLYAMVRDISHRKATEVALQQTQEEAQKANQAKRQFLANMSHELRTPLNTVIGYSEMLAEDAQEMGEKAFVDDLNKIYDAGYHLLNLINDMLDLSKIEAGVMETHREQVNLATLIDSVQTTVKPLIAKNHNSFKVVYSEDIGHIYTDEKKLRQILVSLLSNASKLTSKGIIALRINRHCRNGKEHLNILVSDTGVGISPHNLKKLFQGLSQGDTSATHKYDGTSLGLSLSQRFVEILGGKLTVTSKINQGSRFTVDLPLEPETNHLSHTTTAPLSVPHNTQGTILLIDDDPDTQSTVLQTLQKAQFHVEVASDGETGLQLAQELQPDLILLDIQMPGLDGFQVLEILKADDELSHIPVIMASVANNRDKSFSMGALDYLPKPLRRDDLLDTIGKYATSQSLDILIVDDEPNIRDYVKRVLHIKGYQVSQAANGYEALEQLKVHVPDLILLDLMMPHMDGFELVATLQNHPKWSLIPVIILTAKEMTLQERQQLLSHQATKILLKGSLGSQGLLEQIQAALKIRL